MKKISSKKSFLFLTTALLVVSAFFAPTIAAATPVATITSLNLTAPVGGELWRGTQDITWTSTTNPPGGGNNISILISTNGGVSYNTLVSSILSSDGTYSWNTTTSGAGALADGNNYRIKIWDSTTGLDSLSASNFTVDNTAPTTTYTPSFAPDGLASWYITTPTITLSCDDGVIGSGCNNIRYKWEDESGYTIYTVPFSAREGEHTLSYYSDDNATDNLGVRNEEIVKTQVIKVDTTFPTVAVTSTTTDGSYKAGSSINVTLTFSEAVSSTDTVKVQLDTLGSCTTPIITNSTTATCTYIVGAGENSLDLTSLSVSPTSGVVEDVAGNDSTLLPTSNIADTSNIIIDTTSPIPFTVGAVVTTGGTVVPLWWNSTNTGANVTVPVDNDTSLTGGTIQLQAEADGTYENIGAPYTILSGDINSTKTLSLTATEIEALAGFSDADNLTFRAIITDLAENATTGTQSVNNFDVDQTLPSVDAGIDEEVNAIVSQDATVTDATSDVFSYLWTGGSVISFGTPTAEDTTISAGGDGIYTITLTVADNAGNVNSDTIEFAWDTTKPVITEVTPIKNPTNDTTPTYIFSVDSVNQLPASVGGIITYGGACGAGDLLTAVVGSNSTTYSALGNATYSDCTIIVTDAAGNSNLAFPVNTFEVDTIVALVVSSDTYDTDLDGKIDKTIITFDDELSDATLVTSQFTIGGVDVTGYLTGAFSNDAIIEFTVAGGVAGTEAKSVAYAEGTVTDLAGNTIAFYSQMSNDKAGPIMLSAETKTTTSIDTTWSEDLLGTSVNSSGDEFVVTGYSVSAASETSDGVVTLTVATMPTDATPLITFTSAFFRDLNGQDAPTPQTITATDGVAPVLTAVSIKSDNALDTTLAKAGDTITLTFTSSEVVSTPTVSIAGVSADSVTSVGNNWTATRAMAGTDTQGNVAFSIDFEDLSDNDGTTVTAVMDGSAVFYDSVNPSVDAGTDKEVNAVVNQDATVTDGGSGILSYLWTNETPTIGTITFGTANAEDTTILADTDGTYTIRLTVSDKAGNIAFDEITFIWDTTRPEPLTASPSDGSTGISIASGTTSVTFDEPVVLLDSSRILFVDDVTGTSYKGTVAVNGSNPAMLDIPYSALNYGTKYRVNVKPNAVSDVATNKLNSNFISYFTTEIDTVAPVVDSSSAGSITTSGATLYVTTDENANCGYALTDSAYNAMTPFTTTGTASHYTAVSGLSPSTGHDYYVRCADTSTQANEMTSSAHISFTTLTPDTTAPVITNIQANANDAGATITWATDENATSRVEYGLTSGYGSFTASDTTADLTSHSVIITGLTPGEDYHFRILSDDASLNAGVSGDNTFTTADTTAPAVPVITTASATTDADTYTLAGTIANDGGARTISVYNGATPAGTTIVPTGSTSWTLLVQLTQETANVFTATASDVLGNPSAPSSSVTIIEATATGDVTDPAIPVITTADATVDANEYTISGTAGADDPADATNGTRTITIYNNGVVMGSIVLLTGETDWSFVASLNQNTGNTFSAHSTDESGNTSDASNSVVITELSVADTTAPATPIITTGAATVDANEYTISGTAGADEPTDGTRTITIYRNTVTTVVGSITLLSGQTEWSFVAPLTQNSSNTFTAISTDEAGNNSVVSNSVTITESTAEVTSVVVTNISAVKTYATVGGDYAGGWEWTFNVTVPTTETELQMKFDDWTTSLPNTISAAGNIRYSSVQASNGPFEIVTTGTYGGALHLTNDLDSEITGRQIQIKVEARVPAGSSGGSYSTSYGIQSLPQAD